MTQIFIGSYKDVLARIKEYDLDDFSKLTLLIEELSEAKDSDGVPIYDYGTIAKAVTDFMRWDV